MVASIGKGTVAQYYLMRTEYYLNGKEPVGVWLSNSAALGIKVGQIVEADLFEKLHAGVGPDGRSLITNDGGLSWGGLGAAFEESRRVEITVLPDPGPARICST